MKAIGMPPSDPRVRQMNDAQWLWCYFNEMEDEKEDAEIWKSRFDYLTWFINYEMAKSVHEHNESNKSRSGNQGPRYQRRDIHQSSGFQKEAYAATKGYNPENGLTVDEFLEELEGKQPERENDIMNDSFDDLLASGEFVEVQDASLGIGNPNESFDDFITRALMFEEQIDYEAAVKQNGNSFNASPSNENAEHHETIIDDDLDIFEVDDE